MTFVAPWAALLAAAIAGPLLLLLYFLKLRRRFVRIPSTLLWDRTTEDMQVNVPFQRLRFSVMLVLQLLVLIALIGALSQPRIEADAVAAPRIVLLVDRSASMNATDAGGRTRLEQARATARGIVNGLSRGSEGTDVLIIAFAGTAGVVSGFESNRETLIERLDAIAPSNGTADLAEALRLAEAFSRQTDEDAKTPTPADVVLISDGGVDDPESANGFSMQAGRFRFVRVGPEPGEAAVNVGIVSFSARRDFDDPGRVLVFARLTNTGGRDVETVLTLRRDGAASGLQRIRVPAGGEASTTFALDLAEGAILEVSHNVADALAADDRAYLVLPPPARPRVAIVHAGETPDPFIREALDLMEIERLEILTEERFQSIDTALVDGRTQYDLVIFDRVSPARLPGVSTITFGGVPAGIRVTAGAPEGGRRLLTWERQHPLMRHVGLDDVVFSAFSGFELPAGGKTLAFGPDGPVIAEIAARGARHVLVGFDLRHSNWPVQVSFAVFMANALDYLTLAATGPAAQVHRPGEPITVRVRPGVQELRITGPGPESPVATLAAAPGSLRSITTPDGIGVYQIEGAGPPDDRVAVSLLSDRESDIRPPASLTVNARAVQAGSARDAAPRELWPWLVTAAGVLLILEWITYCWRMSR